MNNNTLTLTIRANVSALKAALRTAQDSVKSFANTVGSGASNKISGFFKKIIKDQESMTDTFKRVGDAGAKFIKGGVVASIAAVAASVPSAVRRVDTLKNSIRTFENMGISTVAARKAMDALEKSIRGLPTPLDDAVSGMTQLTSTYGSIELGQKMFTSLNNAILGFGGTNEMVKNAITQISQLPMDGPLDAATWNSLRNSGLTPVLVAMAKESGMSVSKMKEA